MAGRGKSSGGSKRGKRDRAPRRDSPAFQRRIDRHHGGPPAHIVAKANLERAARRAAQGAKQAARPERVASKSLPEPIVAPPRAAGVVKSRSAAAGTPARRQHPRATPVPSVPLVGPLPPGAVQRSARPPARPAAVARPRRSRGMFLHGAAVALAIAPVVASLALLSQRTYAPPPDITLPMSSSVASSLRDAALRQRIVRATPDVRLSQLPPAWPGSITFAALAVPKAPPDVPPIDVTAPLILLPRPVLALPSVPPSIWPVPERQIVAAFAPLPLPPMPAIEAPAVSDAGSAELTPRNPGLAAQSAEASAQCRPVETVAWDTPATPPDSVEAFGRAIAAAALEQVERFVVYEARYTPIAYPAGDVASLYGVCTDVVIRAYRRLGIDLQRIVYESRVGQGDSSIDHRRTETLRRFFATRGDVLPISSFAEDFAPGDIVTYYRPQNRISTAHIAIVSDQIGPSGRPMIIHNRGLGVQLEDALFVDRITGHYRYLGPKEPLPPLPLTAHRPAPAARARGVPQSRLASGPLPVQSPPVLRASAKSSAATALALRQRGSTPLVPVDPRSPGSGSTTAARRP